MENDHLVERNQRLFDAAFPTAYNEAIPTSIHFIDTFELDLTAFDFANQWITALLGQRNATFTIQPQGAAVRKVEHLYFTARNSAQIKGYKNLGFGYPILSKKDGQAAAGFMAAPIFIWSTQLDPTLHKENNWHIGLTDSIAVRINPVLGELDPAIGALIEKYNRKISKKGVNRNLCHQFCAALAELLNYENNRPNYSIEKFPDIVELGTMPGNGAIVWSGVFAAFPPIHFYSLTDSILSKEYWQEPIPPKGKDYIQFSYLPNDHQQKAAYLAVQKHKFVLVEGATGSGKNRTIANLLISNLLNGERTIIVGESVVTLEKIVNQLMQAGFDEYAFLFKNLSLDKDNLINALLAKAEKNSKKKVGVFDDFLLKYRRFQKLNQQLEQATEAFATNIFDINNWTESVGLFLKNSRYESKELLDTQLNVNDFTFDFLEYEKIREQIAESQRLFQEEFSFYHPLNDLSNKNFASETVRLAQTKLEAQLNKFLKKTRTVQRVYLTNIGLYKNALEDHYEQHYTELNNQIEVTQDYIDQLELQFGKDYHKTSVGNLKLFGNFSEKSKTALILKSKILQQFEQLKKIYFTQPTFDFEFLETASNGNIEVLAEQLNHFQNSLNDWRHKNQAVMQESVKNLNSKTVYSGIKHADKIIALEDLLAKLITEINDSQVFIKPFKNNSMTLQLRQQLLDEVVEQINRSLFGLRDFATFFQWRKLNATFSTKEEKVIKALIKVRPKDWLAAFDAWYFHNLLTQQNRQSGQYEPLLNAYLAQHHLLQQKVPNYVAEVWQQKRLATITATKKRGKSTYISFLKKSNNRASFAKYFQIHWSRITHFFPVLLMTTEMAKELLDGTIKDKLDHLIIKEGTALTKEQGGGLLRLAHQVQVFGAVNEQPTFQRQSFWNLAQSLAGKQITLKTFHQKTTGAIAAFNNAAFDQQLAFVLEEELDAKAIQIHSINGDYDDELKVNEAECRQMLSLLTEVSGTPQNTYPKVGFVCATVEQRNLFSTYLLKIKQNKSNGADKILHLERNDMRVYSFDELSGQRFDILFISFTYGVVDAIGNISKEIDYLGTPKGEIILQKLLNSARQQLIICHSFPANFIQQKRQTLPKNGLSILATLLAYGKALHKNNRTELNQLLSRLKQNKVLPKMGNKRLFMEEVAHYLSAYFEPDRILSNQIIKGQVYPLVIKGEEGDATQYVIQADNYAKEGDVFSFTWQEQMNNDLAAQGYVFLNIWSKDWWRKPEKEARKLASRIIRVD